MLHGHIGPRASGFRVALIEPLYLRGNIALSLASHVMRSHIGTLLCDVQSAEQIHTSTLHASRCPGFVQPPLSWLHKGWFSCKICAIVARVFNCQKKQNIITRYIYIGTYIIYNVWNPNLLHTKTKSFTTNSVISCLQVFTFDAPGATTSLV